MITTYLINNQEHLKELIQPLTNQYYINLANEPIFKEELDRQYKDHVVSTIVDEVTKRLGVSSEEVMIVLEGINLKEYLK